MSLAHVIVDEFTDTPLQGSQLLAVFEDGSALSDDQMQRWDTRPTTQRLNEPPTAGHS